MAKQIMQFRYYNDEDNNDNQPGNVTCENFTSGSVFTPYLPFTQIGIQTMPGVRMYLNNNTVGPVIIGSTGIYQLDLEGISEITDLYFDTTSMEMIRDNPGGYLIIDVVSNVE